MSGQPDNAFTEASPASFGLIGTLSVAFMQIAAPFASVGLKRYGRRAVLALAGTLFFAACILASLSTRLWQFILTQGFLLGLSTCLVFTTAVTITPTWYNAHRGLAMGFILILAGTGVGGLVWGRLLSGRSMHGSGSAQVCASTALHQPCYRCFYFYLGLG